MAKINLSRFVFDYDLTFAMTAHYPDGRILSRFGGRNQDDAEIWLSRGAMKGWLSRCLQSHRAESAAGRKATVWSPDPGRTIMDLPAFKKHLNGRKPECVHCHNILPAYRRQALAEKTWDPRQKYIYPDPKRLGLTLDRVAQRKVTAVQPSSPASAAGVLPGDVLMTIDEIPVLSISDIQHALHLASPGKTSLKMTWARKGKTETGSLTLGDGWKTCTPWEYAWRPMKWELSPAPGFGGRMLSSGQKEQLGISRDAFAMKVGYIVDWGKRREIGRNVHRAGLKKGDVVLSVNGKSDFRSGDHFHSWVRLVCRAGDQLQIEVMRGKSRKMIALTLLAD